MTENAFADTFRAAADYYRSQVLADDHHTDNSVKRDQVSGVERRLSTGQPLNVDQHELATRVLARYLGHLSRGGYSGETQIAKDQVAAVHAAQAALREWPRLDAAPRPAQEDSGPSHGL